MTLGTDILCDFDPTTWVCKRCGRKVPRSLFRGEAPALCPGQQVRGSYSAELGTAEREAIRNSPRLRYRTLEPIEEHEERNRGVGAEVTLDDVRVTTVGRRIADVFPKDDAIHLAVSRLINLGWSEEWTREQLRARIEQEDSNETRDRLRRDALYRAEKLYPARGASRRVTISEDGQEIEVHQGDVFVASFTTHNGKLIQRGAYSVNGDSDE